MVARARGAAGRYDKDGYLEWDEHEIDIASSALEDIAVALGYPGENEYNEACAQRPDDVRARLAAL